MARRVQWRLFCLTLALSFSSVNPSDADGSVGIPPATRARGPRQDDPGAPGGKHPPVSPLRPVNRNMMDGGKTWSGGSRGGRLKITRMVCQAARSLAERGDLGVDAGADTQVRAGLPHYGHLCQHSCDRCSAERVSRSADPPV